MDLDGNRAEKGNEVSGWCSIASTLGKWLGDPAPSREEAQRNQTPSSRAGGVISQLLSQDSRVVTVYSVHCVQCVLSTSATASNPNALATIPTPSATFRPVRSVQDGCTVPQSFITCVGHGLMEKRGRGRCSGYTFGVPGAHRTPHPHRMKIRQVCRWGYQGRLH